MSIPTRSVPLKNRPKTAKPPATAATCTSGERKKYFTDCSMDEEELSYNLTSPSGSGGISERSRSIASFGHHQQQQVVQQQQQQLPGAKGQMDLKKEYKRYCKLYSSEPLDVVAIPLSKANFGKEPYTVDLRGKGLRGVDCIALGKILASDAPIGHLNLSDCLLLPQGFQALMDGLCKNTKLQTLELRGNNIQGPMVSPIAKFLKINTTLKRLLLEWNQLGATAEAFSLFCEGLSFNTGLEHIDLRNNQITAEMSKEFGDVLRKNSTLKEMDLRWNAIGLPGAKAIWESLRFNFNIARIQLQGNFIPDDIISYIEQCLEKQSEREVMMEEYTKRTTILTRQLQKTEQEYEKEIDKMANAHNEEEEELKLTIGELRTKISELEKQLSEEVSNASELSLQVQKLKSNLRCAQEKDDTLQKALEIKEEHSQELEDIFKKEIDTLKKSFEERIKSIEDEQIGQEKDVYQANTKIKKLEALLEMKSSEALDLHERIEVMKKSALDSRENYEERIRSEREKWSNWKEEIETNEKREIKQLEEELKEMQASLLGHIKSLEKGKADAEEEVRHLKVSLVTCKTETEEELTKLRMKFKEEEEQNVDNHSTQISELNEDRKKLEVEIQRLTTLVRKFESENGMLMRQNENLRQQISRLDNELLSKDAQIHSSLTRARNEVREQIEQLSKEEGANKLLRTQVLELQEEMATLTIKQQREIQEKFSELDHWKTQVERKDLELNRLKEEDMRRAELLFSAFLAYMRSTSAATGIPLPNNYWESNSSTKIGNQQQLNNNNSNNNLIMTPSGDCPAKQNNTPFRAAELPDTKNDAESTN